MPPSENLQPPAEVSPADIEAEVADIFGLDLGGGVTPPKPAEEPAASPEPKPGEGEVAPAPSPVPEPVAPAPAPATPPVPPAEPPAAPAAAPVAPSEDALKLQSLEAQNRALQESVRQLQERLDTPSKPQPAATPETADGQPQPVRFNLTVPDEMSNAIFGEDMGQAKAGLTHLVNSLSSHITNTVLALVRQELSASVTAAKSQQEQNAAASTQVEEMEKAKNAYFAAFPAHNKPTLIPVIQHQASLMAVEFPNLPWDANYINALGVRVNRAIQELTGAPAAPTPTPTPAPTVPVKPAAMMPSGPREPVNFLESDGDFIADMFSID